MQHMQVKSVHVSVCAALWTPFSQNSGVDSVVSPTARHLASPGPVSEDKVACIGSSTSAFAYHKHTVALFLPWCQHMYHSFFCLMPLGRQPSAKKKETHVKVLSAPSNLCCHLDVRSVQLPVPGEVQGLKVKTQETSGGGSSLGLDGPQVVTWFLPVGSNIPSL